jgi:hypothetical protein
MIRPSTRECRRFPRRKPFSRLARMPRMRLPIAGFAAALAATLALVACGGEDAKLLPGETAREITANLDTVQQLANEGDCVGAESAVVQVGEQIEALEGVDPKLKQALEGGAARLEEVIAGCEETSEAIAPAEVPSEGEEEAEREARQKEAKPGREKPKEAKPKEEEAAPEEAEEPPVEEAAPESPSGGVSPGAPIGGGE